KRHAARRANTTEHRATHNAVERMRRETLNGRFLVRIFPLVFVFSSFLARRGGREEKKGGVRRG
ncbi:hypothetical protein B0H10DRAFT_1834638, partial [Mycena sp. CBHHK59/15]